uniref:30S ribosomal protein S18 n=1 Tax=Candidatus Karelsulcia muelleri TaxID=336810 RepID=UPI0032B22B3D
MKKNNLEPKTKIVKPKRSSIKSRKPVNEASIEVVKPKRSSIKSRKPVNEASIEVVKPKRSSIKSRKPVNEASIEVVKPKRSSIKSRKPVNEASIEVVKPKRSSKNKTAIFPIKNKILEYFNNEINKIFKKKKKKIYFRLDEYKLLNNNIILNKKKKKKIIFNLKKKLKKKKIIKYKQNIEEIELRFLTPFEVKLKEKKKYCFFKKANIGYVDFKNPLFLIKFLNERAEILPRRITGTSKKFQRKIKIAVKRCKQIGLLPYLTDRLRK